jgi:hypothetical protein
MLLPVKWPTSATPNVKEDIMNNAQHPYPIAQLTQPNLKKLAARALLAGALALAVLGLSADMAHADPAAPDVPVQPQPASSVLDGVTVAPQPNDNQAVDQGTDLNMIAIQSLINARQQAMQLTTNQLAQEQCGDPAHHELHARTCADIISQNVGR